MSRQSKARRHFNKMVKSILPEVLAKTGGVCIYCGGIARTPDHFTPLAVAGRAGNVIENLVPACRSCNLHKNALMPEAYRRKRRFFGDSHGSTFIIVRKPQLFLPTGE
jgi:5-methylcytosine-specific restriction endonuclease McrA